MQEAIAPKKGKGKAKRTKFEDTIPISARSKSGVKGLSDCLANSRWRLQIYDNDGKLTERTFSYTNDDNGLSKELAKQKAIKYRATQSTDSF